MRNLSSGSFQYAGSKLVPFVEGHHRVLKEWGEPIGPDDDICDLDDLDEFESTDLSSLWLERSPSNEASRIRSSSFIDIEEPLPKRRKLDLYPLHNRIPHVRVLAHLA